MPSRTQTTLGLANSLEVPGFDGFAVTLRSVLIGDAEDKDVELLVTSSREFDVESGTRVFALQFPDSARVPGRLHVHGGEPGARVEFGPPSTQLAAIISFDGGGLEPDAELLSITLGADEQYTATIRFTNITARGIDYVIDVSDDQL